MIFTSNLALKKSYIPPIADGLIIRLDAADTNSYEGSGTTWNDLSENNNNGTLTNGPIYSQENGGGIAFDGVNDYVAIPYSGTMNFALGQSICMWLQPGTGANSQRRNPYNQNYGGSGTMTREQDGTINYFFGTNGGDASPYVGRNSGFTVPENELAFITVTRDQASNTCKWYKNGELVTTLDAGGYSATANSTSPIWIGDGYVEGWLGTIYLCLVYNRALTEDEVLQNYDHAKDRYAVQP